MPIQTRRPHIGLSKLLLGVTFAMTVLSGPGCDPARESAGDGQATQATGSASFSASGVFSGADMEQRQDPVGTRMLRSDSLTLSRANAITRAVEAGSQAVVNITVREVVQTRRRFPDDDIFQYFFGYNMPREYTSFGSGFLISEDGLVVTNHHVIGSANSTITVTLISGESYPARVLGFDELTDIALLRIERPEPFPYLDFSPSEQVIVGEWAIALGNPFGLFEDGKPTVTVGVVSAKNRDFRPDPNNPRVYIDMIQTDAAINRGNSGGPLLNSLGQVIGINTFIYTGGTGAGFVGLGFAIPSTRIEMIVSQLLTSGEVNLDFDPGLEFTPMTEALVFRYNLPYIQGLLVTEVNRDGPAYESGILPGDIILRFGEERVVSGMHAKALLRQYKNGDTLRVELLRDRNRYEARMVLREKVMASAAQ